MYIIKSLFNLIFYNNNYDFLTRKKKKKKEEYSLNIYIYIYVNIVILLF